MGGAPLRLTVEITPHPHLDALHLETVEAQKHGNASVLENGGQCVHERIEVVEFVVHSNAQRLEQTRARRLLRVLLLRQHLVHTARQIHRGLERVVLPPFHDGVGHTLAGAKRFPRVRHEDR